MAVALDVDGTLHARLRDEAPDRSTWLEAHWPDTVLGDITRATDDDRESRVKPIDPSMWLRTVDRLLPPAEAQAEAVRLISLARHELIGDDYWFPSAHQEALHNAAARGVRCYRRNGAVSLSHWNEFPDAEPGFLATSPRSDPSPRAIVVDAEQALSSTAQSYSPGMT